MRRFVQICESAGLKSLTVPALQDLISGKSKIDEIHQVDLADLLGREPVTLDLNSVRQVLTGNVVLVTGAAGSIGSELCRQILEFEPLGLVCVDHNETGLFYLQMELNRVPQGSRVSYCVTDYSDAERMQRIFSINKVQIVFHAAAYKHVPLMEQNPREAIQNNVFGLFSLLHVANAASCKSFVLISSDKAVNPSSIMGCSKRLCELIMASFPSSQMRCVSVRFGNVLGSQGSVVPIFQRQLLEKRCITVTHPDITRFFMTIREAVSLVLQAGAIGEDGDILVLDMGEPVRIVDLARTLIQLSGKTERDVKIVFSGLRPGEKLYEELFYADEEVMDTACEKIKRTCGTVLTWAELEFCLGNLRDDMYALSDDELREELRTIVPQYVCAIGNARAAGVAPHGSADPAIAQGASA
jgi:FlaA1/EpsC-like NDP-sugar epimerase